VSVNDLKRGWAMPHKRNTNYQKLNNYQVSVILLLLERHIKQKYIAACFGVTPSHISKIATRQTYKSVLPSSRITPEYRYLLHSKKYMHSISSLKKIPQLICLLHHGVKQNILSSCFGISASYVCKISKGVVYRGVLPASTIDPVYRYLLISPHNISALYQKDKIAQIKALLGNHVPQKYIALRFGISDTYVCKIFKRVSYRNVKPSDNIYPCYRKLLKYSRNRYIRKVI
jgi:AraC-like DNA-binding protein